MLPGFIKVLSPRLHGGFHCVMFNFRVTCTSYSLLLTWASELSKSFYLSSDYNKYLPTPTQGKQFLIPSAGMCFTSSPLLQLHHLFPPFHLQESTLQSSQDCKRDLCVYPHQDNYVKPECKFVGCYFILTNLSPTAWPCQQDQGWAGHNLECNLAK